MRPRKSSYGGDAYGWRYPLESLSRLNDLGSIIDQLIEAVLALIADSTNDLGEMRASLKRMELYVLLMTAMLYALALFGLIFICYTKFCRTSHGHGGTSSLSFLGGMGLGGDALSSKTVVPGGHGPSGVGGRGGGTMARDELSGLLANHRGTIGRMSARDERKGSGSIVEYYDHGPDSPEQQTHRGGFRCV